MTKLFITGDYYLISGLGSIVRAISTSKLEENMSSKDYGTSINHIGIILFCNDFEWISPAYQWKPRIRFTKKDLWLSMDIVFDFIEMFNAEDFERKEIVAQRLLSDTTKVIAKYKFKDFDLARFEHDLEIELKNIGFIS